MAYNADNPSAVAKRTRHEKRERELDREAIEFVMRSASGRRFVYMVLDDLNYFKACSSYHATEMFQFNGARNRAVNWAGMLRENFTDEFLAMLSERWQAEKRTAEILGADENEKENAEAKE